MNITKGRGRFADAILKTISITTKWWGLNIVSWFRVRLTYQKQISIKPVRPQTTRIVNLYFQTMESDPRKKVLYW